MVCGGGGGRLVLQPACSLRPDLPVVGSGGCLVARRAAGRRLLFEPCSAWLFAAASSRRASFNGGVHARVMSVLLLGPGRAPAGNALGWCRTATFGCSLVWVLTARGAGQCCFGCLPITYQPATTTRFHGGWLLLGLQTAALEGGSLPTWGWPWVVGSPPLVLPLAVADPGSSCRRAP